MEKSASMRNRVESRLNNQTFSDITAWRAIRNADRTNRQKVDVLPAEFDHQENSITIYQQPERPNIKTQQPSRKSQLHQELTRLNILKDNGCFTTKQEKAQFRMLRKQLRQALQVLEQE